MAYITSFRERFAYMARVSSQKACIARLIMAFKYYFIENFRKSSERRISNIELILTNAQFKPRVISRAIFVSVYGCFWYCDLPISPCFVREGTRGSILRLRENGGKQSSVIYTYQVIFGLHVVSHNLNFWFGVCLIPYPWPYNIYKSSINMRNK